MKNMKENDRIHLAYLIGVKAGVESFVKALEETEKTTGLKYTMDTIKLTCDKVLSNIEAEIKSVDNGAEFLELLKNEQ